jgi:hypothetical protein
MSSLSTEPVFEVRCVNCESDFVRATVRDHSKVSLLRYHSKKGPVEIRYVDRPDGPVGNCKCPARYQ